MHWAKNTVFRDLIAKTSREGAMTHYENKNDPIKIYSNYTLDRGTHYKNVEPPTMLIAAPSTVSVQGKASDDKEVSTKESSDKMQGVSDYKMLG